MGILLTYIGWGRQGSIHHDEELFKQPPLNEDCPICMLPLPTLGGVDGYIIHAAEKLYAGDVFMLLKREIRFKNVRFA